jgi:hypothetical protein
MRKLLATLIVPTSALAFAQEPTYTLTVSSAGRVTSAYHAGIWARYTATSTKVGSFMVTAP